MKLRQSRKALSALAAAATLLSLADWSAVAAEQVPNAPRTTTTPVLPVGADTVPADNREALLGPDWSTSADVAWTTSGDAQGFHILTAQEKDGYTWKTTATLSEPGLDVDAWIGNVCVTGSGRRAVVVYAPRTFTNKPQLMARGGFTAVVDLASGKVTKLPLKASLSYYNPGCGTDESAVLTQSGGDDMPGTRLIRLDAATGKLSDPVKVTGQVTSAVPAPDGTLVGASGAQVVRISGTGKRTPLVRTDGVPYRITPDGEGGLSFLDKRKDTTKVKRIGAKALAHPAAEPAEAAVLAQGPAAGTGLTRSAGTVYITGSTTRPKSTKALPSVVRRLANVPKDATVSTRGASVITGTAWGDGKGTMVLQGDADKARAVKLSMTVTDSKAKTSFVVDPERHESARLAEGMAMSPGLTGHAQAKAAVRSLVIGPSSPTDPVEDERTCSVPRNDPRNQAMQPKPRQVEWAVDQAITGYLNTHVQRPANWKNLGMPAYMPQELFLNPVLDGGGRAMAQVMLGVTTQESNMWQAGREAVPGVTANPLIGNYYGIDLYDGDSSNDWDVDFAEADCGYGITQVTDHMRMAGREDGHGGAAWDYQKQRAVALDYTANIAAGLQILVSKWNETRAAGLVANHGADGRPENWYFALWAYNSGFHPNTGDGAPWGLGWANNPANPEWDAGRLPFMENAAGGENAAAAAHPQDWPYQEKVLGFAAHPPSFLESPGVLVPAFRPSSWNGTNEAVSVKGSALYNRAHVKAPEDAFCVPTSNDCFPGRISDSASNDNGSSGPCAREDFMCWWHEPVTWKTDCPTTCGFEFVRFNSSYAEEADGTAYPPVCTTTGLPSGALIIDDVPEDTPVVRPGCSNSGWDNAGTFSFDFSNNGTESVYPSKADLHQLGAGFGGHFWFGHTRLADAKGERLKIQGTWRLRDKLTSEAKVMVHLPDHGAQTQYATYEIDTAYGTERRQIAQPGNGNRWVSLGAFRFNNTPEVRLDTIASDGTGDEDIAFDAVAFVPGNYDLIPDIRLPAGDPNAPEPADEEPIQVVPGELFPGVAPAKSAQRSAGETPTAFQDCRPVKGSAHTELCIGPASAAAEKKAQEAPAGVARIAGDTSFCSARSEDKYLTRTSACLKDAFAVVKLVDEVPVASSTFTYRHVIDLDIRSGTFVQTVSLTPQLIDPKMLEVGLNIQSFCQPNCSPAGPTFTGAPLWVPGDTHTATATIEHSWTGTSGNDRMHLNWIISGTVEGKPTTSHDYDADTEMTIRCDKEAKGVSVAGCVFPEYTPTYVVNSYENPSAAAFYWILMQKLPSHPGSRDHNQPLNYLASKERQEANRGVICPKSGADKWVGNPETLQSGSSASCDEYPFAATYQSGGMPPQQVLSGKDCTQMYAKPLSSGWTVLEDPNYSRVNTWTEICGRATIPGDENSGAAWRIGLVFVPKNRMLDKDKFFVSTPGFEDCSDLAQVCFMRSRS